MTNLAIFREYEPHELGADGYPHVWHRGIKWDLPDDLVGRAPAITVLEPDSPHGVKDVVRAEAGHRCIRCRHPYRDGEFTWQDDAPAPMVGDLPPSALSLAGMRADAVGAHAGRPTHWSPCDAACRHGAPVRVHDVPPRTAGDPWRYSWPSQAREALNVNDEFNAGMLVRDGLAVEAAWRILTVHHLNGRKHDLRWWNLTSLCQRCHLLIQKTVILERVWPWEHDEWFKPYAAGWYAYAYLGQSLGRDEVADRRDELLALERMA